VLVQVATDCDRRAPPLLRRSPGPPQRVAQPEAAANGQLALTAHAGEGTIKVQIGDVEKACAHAVVLIGPSERQFAHATLPCRGTGDKHPSPQVGNEVPGNGWRLKR
jgi:hypothetical protein